MKEKPEEDMIIYSSGFLYLRVCILSGALLLHRNFLCNNKSCLRSYSKTALNLLILLSYLSHHLMILLFQHHQM